MKQIPANRTGVDASPHAADMLEVVELARPSNLTGDTFAQIEAKVIATGAPTGSPPPAPDAARRFLLDQLSARCNYERGGTRLYEALLRKSAVMPAFPDGPEDDELALFRDQEAQHFHLLHAAIRELGGDPTLVSPCANLEVICATGVIHAVNDPRHDLGESLSAILVTELNDVDAWGSLIDLTRAAGQDELADRFAEAEAHEADHLAHVRAWVAAYRSWRLDGNGERGGASGVVATAATKLRKAAATGTRRVAGRRARPRARAR
ncbi:MAG TPA: ferritin-like domain-containing protein [Planctomycetota bacterium]|nr:ferritin-like domain-containing protein [Planctomycetota bacterium]